MAVRGGPVGERLRYHLTTRPTLQPVIPDRGRRGEVSRAAQPGEIVEEGEIQVDGPVGRAVERPHREEPVPHAEDVRPEKTTMPGGS